MVRCVIRPEQLQRGLVTLDARQTKHVVTVLRLRPGDDLVMVPEGGDPMVARLEPSRGSRITARVVRPAPRPPPEPWAVTLAAAVPKRPGAFDQIVDQATQVGVAAIIPMTTARSVVRPVTPQESARHRRWGSLAREAAQQSGRATVPRVAPITPLADVLAQASEYDRLLMPTVGAQDDSVIQWLHPPVPRRLAILIGPEGDFTPDEIAHSARAGVMPISLGHNVLRCESAALAVLAVVLHTLRQLEGK
ncbi:MAG: 16S rRNA (uracil(1498)-N(3))-methyltransferase [Candidatus Omnitrophica bacterium]|nr:16S rRNA (uracil(1498)-N(3))-methyltransferase [Candidatus Omnitrophota bacterium]